MFRDSAKLAIKSVHGCTLLMMRQRRCAVSPVLLKIACPEVYVRVHFRTRVFASQKHRFCFEPRTSLSVLKLQGASKKHPQTRPKINILVHFWATSLQEQTCFCLEPAASVPLSAFPALLQIGGADTRREQKLTAGVLFAR